jgi:HD-GYP domain-containing protein (c-di-GMP phosphodiesterase class II)
VTKHPIFVFDMLKDASHIPNRSAFIAYQIHERCNGKGYPRRREANQIHFLSKVAAVADVYVGLVSPRPHRPGMLPYLAVERLLHGVRNGLFDRTAVRALLNTISLFPIGSYVELSDGRVGRVLRANGERYDRPVLEVWEAAALQMEPQIVDLAATDASLRVVRALPMLKPAPNRQLAVDHWD